jgi:hypothetical protein
MLKYLYNSSNYKYLIFLNHSKIVVLIIKDKLNYIYSILNVNLINIFQFNKKLYNFLLNKFLYLNNFNNLYYIKLFNIGLGYKNFVYKKFLYIYEGDANYYKFNYNKKKIYILCKKGQLFFFSKYKDILFNFINKIIKLKNINIYKGKGIIPFKNFKFMQLKKGKRKN